MRVRIMGLSRSPQYNGLTGTIQGGVEGGRMRVVLDQTGKVLSLKRENLLAEMTGDSGEKQAMRVFNVQAPTGFQPRSRLERSMRDWFEAHGPQPKFVVWGPGGSGKSTLARMFAAARAAEYVSLDSLGLVFVLSATNIEQDYLGLLGVLESDSGAGAAREAQHLSYSMMRQRVHELLSAAKWRGLWLGVLDDLPAPEAMEEAGLEFLLEEFPWAHGRTVITTRAAEWTHDDAISVPFDSVDGDEQRKCEQCGKSTPALLKGQKCGKCKEAYYCCRKCQKEAWYMYIFIYHASF